MPYIKQDARRRVDGDGPITTPGEFTYYLVRKALDSLPPKPHFEDFAKALGIIGEASYPERDTPLDHGARMCAVLEFYRRVVAPYEDKAIAKNGDIPGLPPLEGKP